MKIIEDTDKRLTIKQPKNIFGFVASTIFILGSLFIIGAIWLKPTGEPVPLYILAIPALIVFVMGGAAILLSNYTMTVTFDKTLGKIILKGKSGNVIETPIERVRKITLYTGTFGVILDDGKRIQYGTGGMKATKRLFYMQKLSNFLGVPVESSVLGDLYKNKS